jgi:putative NADH-flavin reductase
VVTGDSRDPDALDDLLKDAEAVVSVLGPIPKEPSPHSTTAPALIAAMQRAGIRRFVGATGAGINVPGDRKSPLNKAISWLVERIGGAGVTDRINELRIFEASDLDWTFARVPRLTDGPASGKIQANPHRSAKSVRFSRADLATFLADAVTSDSYIRQAPLVGSG